MICLPNAAQEILVKGMEQETDDEMSSSYTTESNRNSYAEDDFLNSDISPQDVTESTDHLKAKKAAGIDGIIPEVLRHFCDNYTLSCAPF